MGVNIRKLLLFIGLTFGLSYTLVGVFLALGGRWNTPGAVIIGVVYMFMPMTSAILVGRLIFGEPTAELLGISWRFNRWFLLAWLLPPIYAIVTLGASLLLPGVRFSPEMAGLFERFRDVLPPEKLQQMESQAKEFPIHPFWIGLLQGLVAGITINAVAAFGEESGWRGFLQRELGPPGFWRSSLLIGLIWGIWHAPLVLQGHNYPQHPVAGVFMMTLFTLLLSPIFSYVRLRAGSVIAAAIIHGSLNATGGLSIMVVEGGSDLTVGITGAAGLMVLAAVDLCIFLHMRLSGAAVEMRGHADGES